MFRRRPKVAFTLTSYHPQEGDVVVFEYDRNVTMETVVRAKTMLEEHLNPARVVLLDQGMKLVKVEPGPRDTSQAERAKGDPR